MLWEIYKKDYPQYSTMGDTKEWQQIPGCQKPSECEHKSLTHFKETEEVQCLSCKERWSEQEAVELGFFDKVRRG